MKYLYLIPLWHRIHIARICLEHLLATTQDPIVCITSETDSESLCDDLGIDRVSAPNLPLGRKKNIGLGYALENYTFDALVELGSDNLLAPEAKNMWEEGINATCVTIVTDGERTKKVNTGQPIGAGRMIHREALDLFWSYRLEMKESVAGAIGVRSKGDKLYVPRNKAKGMIDNGRAEQISDLTYCLWPMGKSRGLDTQSELKLRNFGYPIHYCDREIVVGMKSETNIWSFDDLKGEPCELPTWTQASTIGELQ